MGAKTGAVEKLSLGIPGFDQISFGGLPKYRTTLVSGTVGSGKTVFAAQFLADGVQHANENCVFVTLEESPSEMRKNLASFGWDIEAWEAEGKWLFLDVSPGSTEVFIGGDYNLEPLLIRIEEAIAAVNAKRLVIDSLGAILARLNDTWIVRRELDRIISGLRKRNVTSIITAERTEGSDVIARHEIGEFIADNVIILRNILEQETRRRTIEILKFRGTGHQKREFLFAILPDKGIEIVPPIRTEQMHKSADVRTTIGNEKLDAMCGGGIFRDAIALVSGPSGSGKTMMATQFTAAGLEKGERALFIGYEESREQLYRNARYWRMDFERAEQEGKLKAICLYPEETTVEEHLIIIKKAIVDFKPARLVIDSLSALERISSMLAFREFIVGATSFIRERQVSALFTTTTESLVGAASITEARISTVADIIVLLRFVEVKGSIERALTILKMRGSDHDKSIRQFIIDERGIQIGNPIRNIIGILTGNFRLVADESQVPKAA